MRANPTTILAGVSGLHFQEIGEVDHPRDHLAHIVALFGVGGHHVIQFRIGFEIGIAFRLRRIFQVVGRQEAEQLLADRYRMVVVFGDEVNHAGMGHVRFRAAQLFGGHVFAGDALDDRRAGDEHLRLAGLDDEVGQRGAVGRAACAGSADQRNLRHCAREHHVRVKNFAVAGKGIDAFLNARAAGIVDEDEGRACLQGLLHDFGHFDGMDFAGRTAGDGEVLAGQMHQPAVDRCGAGHHAIRRKAFAGHAEQHGAMFGEQAGFFETVRIHHRFDSLSGRQLALLCAAFPACRRRRPAWLRLRRFRSSVDFFLHCMNGHLS